jgi:DNA polymerase-3 subunit epsilon
MYAIVDIETTGSNTNLNRIIEIAIVTTDGYEILSTYSTLINPGIYIPTMITGLTGITNQDVAGAPDFSSVCEDVFAELEGKIFVAHNVGFDFGFLKSEFEREGLAFLPKSFAQYVCPEKLCLASNLIVWERYAKEWVLKLMVGIELWVMLMLPPCFLINCMPLTLNLLQKV